MSEWKEYKLSDLMEIKYGKDHKHLADGSYPLFGSGGIMRYFEKSIYEEESILIPRKGTLGNLFYVNEPFWSVDTMFWSKIKQDKVLPKYLYYALKTYNLAELNVGSAGPSLTTEVLNKVDVTIPNIEIQSAIAEILSSLDDKIELNNKINQELENLAQTLFKRWFIDFEFPNENGEPYKSSGGEMVESELGEIPKGWDKIKLAKLVTKSHTGADAITRAPIVDYDTGVKCARVGDMTNNRSYHNWAFCKINPQDYARQKLEIGDIIVTRTATLGINQIIRENTNAVCNNGLIRLQIDKSICDPMFVYVQFQGDMYKEWINRISGDSSTRPNMQMDYLLDFNVILPEKELMNVFTESIKTYYDLIDENNKCNEELIKTRDTLLPKLISGELEVNNINF